MGFNNTLETWNIVGTKEDAFTGREMGYNTEPGVFCL
jgi:hypothetical protein